VDYANGLLAGSDRIQIERLQRHDWLCVQKRIKYKLCLLIHKAFYPRSHTYIKELVVPVSQDATTRRLHSADTLSLIRPWNAKLIGDRGFSVAGQSACNDLPVQIRQTRSLIIFKR